MAPKCIESLFKPYSLGPFTLPNRVFMGSLTRNRCINNIPFDIHVEHYCQRVRGGAGLIISEGLLIEPQGYIASSYHDLGILSIGNL
jgi:2,4-dienoyl-CoA reductase-like NADH-dependent reductase (Old Yellow Enzyme family)